MSDAWAREFARRLQGFGEPFRNKAAGIPVSIKIRVVGGCFHREHSPHAYRLIDEALGDRGLERDSFQWQEHESGPELLIWIPLATAGIALSAAVINLVVSILKARSDGIKVGDRPREPLELILRTSRPGDEVVEEKILRFNPNDPVHAKTIQSLLDTVTRKMLPPPAPQRKKRGRRKPRT